MTTPAPTTTEYWDWNGTVLNSPYWNITSFGGSRQDLPLLRGQNYTLAYRAGQMWRQKQFDQRTVSLAMWTAGINQLTGIPSANQSLDFTTNFYNLRSLFAQQWVGGSLLGALTRRWQEYVNGVSTLVSATARAEIAGNMSPTMSGRTRADFTVDLLLADPYFYGPYTPQPAVVVQSPGYSSGTAVITNPGDAVLGYGQSQANGGVAFSIVLTGPLTNPTLKNELAQVQVTFNGSIAAGNTITLDIVNFTAYDQNNVSWLGQVAHSGARPWMVLTPATVTNPTGAQTLSLTTTANNNGSPPGQAQLFYRPGYL